MNSSTSQQLSATIPTSAILQNITMKPSSLVIVLFAMLSASSIACNIDYEPTETFEATTEVFNEFTGMCTKDNLRKNLGCACAVLKELDLLSPSPLISQLCNKLFPTRFSFGKCPEKTQKLVRDMKSETEVKDLRTLWPFTFLLDAAGKCFQIVSSPTPEEEMDFLEERNVDTYSDEKRTFSDEASLETRDWDLKSHSEKTGMNTDLSSDMVAVFRQMNDQLLMGVEKCAKCLRCLDLGLCETSG